MLAVRALLHFTGDEKPRSCPVDSDGLLEHRLQHYFSAINRVSEPLDGNGGSVGAHEPRLQQEGALRLPCVRRDRHAQRINDGAPSGRQREDDVDAIRPDRIGGSAICSPYVSDV
jgi:hypothetical protein